MVDLIVFQIFAFLFTYDNSDLSFGEVKVIVLWLCILYGDEFFAALQLQYP